MALSVYAVILKITERQNGPVIFILAKYLVTF